MREDERTFGVATDKNVIKMIERAKRRLVIIAPAFSRAIADSLAARFDERNDLDIRVIVDPDEEVYRLGYGEPEALEVLKDTISKKMLNVNIMEHSGIRIGIIISDDETMVYAPISKNIEAGSENRDKPNAIFMKDEITEDLAYAAGAKKEISEGVGESADSSVEIGKQNLDPKKVEEMREGLERYPPLEFDIARRLNVFKSRVVYIEFEIKNFRLEGKQVPMPEELKTVKNPDLQARISSRLRSPLAEIGEVEVEIGEGNAKKTMMIDDKWLRKERNRIEKKYTYQVKGFGRVILKEHWEIFDKEIKELEKIVKKYHKVINFKLKTRKDSFVNLILDEFTDIWLANPPERFKLWNITHDKDNVEKELKKLAEKMFSSMLHFEPPEIRVVEKWISPKNVKDERFINRLRELMEENDAPEDIINSLFGTEEAAPVTHEHNDIDK